MKRLAAVWHRLLCRFGRHTGVCVGGNYRCAYCAFVHPYLPGGAHTTDPGGMDGPPYDRPGPWGGVDPEVGARQEDDDSLGIPPNRYLPP